MLTCKLATVQQGIICKDWKISVKDINSQTILNIFFCRRIVFFYVILYVMPINPNKYQFPCDYVNFLDSFLLKVV